MAFYIIYLFINHEIYVSLDMNIKFFFILLIAVCLKLQVDADTSNASQTINFVFVDENGMETDVHSNQLLLENNIVQKCCCSLTPQVDAISDTWTHWLWEQISLEEKIQQNIDAIDDAELDGVLRLAGYHMHLPEVGLCGNGELHGKVRITYVNGILNLQEDIINSAQLISETHGGTNVHYVFRPTLGWAWDLLKSSFVKCGYISQQAYDLAATWRNLIVDMGGVDGGGKIIHYAHSIGAADTYTAKLLLSPKELAMICVVTLGSPVFFPNGDFQSVTNYISVRDGVPYLRKLSVFSCEDYNLVYVGSYFGFPFMDHLLNNGTYRMVIEKLGQEFVDCYTCVRNPIES